MALAPTRFSRVSIGWVSSTESIVDQDPGDTGAVLSVKGSAVFEDITQTGASAFSGGASISNLTKRTFAVAAVSATGHDSVSSSVSWTGAAVGDVYIVTPGSTVSGAYYDVGVEAHSIAANAFNLVFRNSALTTVSIASNTQYIVTKIRFA